MTNNPCFAKFEDEGLPAIPEGYTAPLDTRSTAQLIDERIKKDSTPDPREKALRNVSSLIETLIPVFAKGSDTRISLHAALEQIKSILGEAG